ncbi:MAG: hypothetical protein QOC62_679 [Mycobacterium sp.]|jgi:hypothetical protein|nr:hypothetical protein [Mycobacterium sp.]
MTTTIYTVPDNPADPEAAALELIVRLPGQIMHTDALTEVLQDYCGALHAEGAFTGLSWEDAKQIAAAVSFDAVTRDDAADFIRNRARNVLAGTDNMPWENREGAARAFNIAATVLGL